MGQSSGTLGMARGVFALVGIGAILMAASNLSSGQSLSDPVFPAAIGLGAMALGAARWVEAPQPLAAVATWLGIAAMGVALAVFWGFLLPTTSLDVVALAGVPTLILAAAGVRLGVARRRAGALGTRPRQGSD